MRERTDGEGFATRAIHAARASGPGHARAQHPHLRDGHVRLRHGGGEGGRGRPGDGLGPDGVLLLADRQPHQPARSRRRSPRWRVPRTASSRRRGWPPSRPRLFAHLSSGDHLVVGDELFAITTVLLEEDLPRRGIAVTAVDTTDIAAVEAAITPATRLLFLECSTNPRLRVADLDAITRDGTPARGQGRSPTTRSSARRCSARSSTARTSSCTRRRSTCPVTATQSRAWSRAPRR